MTITEWLIAYQNGIEAGKSGNNDGAIKYFTNCIEIDNDNSLAYVSRAMAFIGLKKYKEALSDTHKAISLAPNTPGAYSTMALIEWLLGDLAASLLYYNQALTYEPNDISSILNRGQVRRDIGELDGAIQDFMKVIDIASSYDDNETAPEKLIALESAKIAETQLSLCKMIKSMPPEAYSNFLKKKLNNNK